jgi:hypothetical protein
MLIAYCLPVVLYTVYAWINPDGVGFGKEYTTCYVVTSKNVCLTMAEADALGGGYNVSLAYATILLIGFCYSLIFVSCLCFCGYH